MVILNLLLIAFFGYLAGSIPTSVWISKAFFGFDIRDKGSGNAGATNAWRILGWKAALIVVLVDIGKGFLAAGILSKFRLDGVALDATYASLIGGLGAILGHVWTLFAGFRGGKGVATMAGMLIALYPVVVPLCLLVFIIVVATTRYVSLGSMLGAACLPFGLSVMRWGMGQPVSNPLIVLAVLLAGFVFFTHRSNIKRLLAGEERKIGAPKSGLT